MTSLQRNAASPDFFRFPRAVVTVDAQPREIPGQAGMLLADRLYLGYLEKAGVLEVISYNEAAARFEFQVVHDYREGGSPRIRYANRAGCRACHQNAAPLFARHLWEETNANREIAAKLDAEQRPFYGFGIDQGVDIVFDTATDRANDFALSQFLWREGCGGDGPGARRCRGELLLRVLQYGLGGARFYDTHSADYRAWLLPHLRQTAAAGWPDGLKLPSADIPNRNPLSPGRSRTIGDAGPIVDESLAALVRESDIPAAFEPLLTRSAVQWWRPSPERIVARAVQGLAGFVAAPDLKRLDRRLRGLQQVSVDTLEVPCEFTSRPAVEAGAERIKWHCGSAPGGSTPLTVKGGGGGASRYPPRYRGAGQRQPRPRIWNHFADGGQTGLDRVPQNPVTGVNEMNLPALGFRAELRRRSDRTLAARPPPCSA